jgi:4'-phosphopantetheinyl transferase
MTTHIRTVLPCAAHDRAAPVALWVVDLVAGAEVLSEFAHRHRLHQDPPASGSLAPSLAGPRTAARAALRIILAGYVGLAAARRPFILARGGKPNFDHRNGAPLDFSLAHCDTAAIIAISNVGPIGVDIEGPRSIRIADHRRLQLVDAATSLAIRDPLPDAPGEARFLQAWVRLEALAKLTGEGLGALLGRLDDDAPPIAGTIVNGSKAIIRDVPITNGSPLFAAVAGIGPTLADDGAPVAAWLPSEQRWLEDWVAGATDLAPETIHPTSSQ